MQDDEQPSRQTHATHDDIGQSGNRAKDAMGLNAPDPVFSGLTEMMRSFVALAEFLNLSHAVDHLKTTRQTVRRHIKLLEAARGAPLFEVRDRQYALTEAGRQALPEAEYILGRSQAWYHGQIGRIAGLESIRRDSPHPYHLQQQPLSTLWRQSGNVLARGLGAWCAAEGALDHPALLEMRPHMIIFRRFRSDWICAEVGPKSAFATWYGPKWERSSIGLPLGAMPGGRTFSRLANRPYDEVEATHGVRYDHIHTTAMREDSPEPQHLSFKRLLIGCRFADGSFALGNIALRSYDLKIDGLNADIIRSMPPGLVEDSVMQ